MVRATLLAVASCFAPSFAFVPTMSAASTLSAFKQGKALKIISGISNFDIDLVTKVAIAAEAGGATHIDIAADPKLVIAARKAAPSVYICVSAIDPDHLVSCVEAGADMVELGNFDSFYDQGLEFSAADVIAMTKMTKALLPNTPLSVTVPHTLHMADQIALAQDLEMLGADIIQTEGKFSLNPSQGGVQGAIERAAPALAATYEIARSVSIPVMAASGVSEVTANMALAAGAKGVGIGSAVNKLNSQVAMVAVVRAIASSMGLKRSVVKEPEMVESA